MPSKNRKLKIYKIRFFANFVRIGSKTLDEIPLNYRQAVEEYLKENPDTY